MAKKEKVTVTAPAGAEVDVQVKPGEDKPAPPPKALGPKGTKDDAKITVVSKDNPKRPQSRAHTLWTLYKDGMTIKEYSDAVVAAGHAGQATPALVYDAKHGFIQIEGYTPPGGVTPPKEPKPKAPPKAKKEKAAKDDKVEAAANAEATEETME